MLKRLVPVAFLLALLAGCAGRYQPVPEPEFPMQVLDGATLKPVSYDDMMKVLHRADAVFVGEIHDDSLTHVLERRILDELSARDSRRVLCLEMFERDVQGLLDDYLSGTVDEATFLAGSRPWGNYQTDYRPLVELAKGRGMPVLAMNVPRRYAGQVAMRGEAALAAVPDSEKVFIANELKPLDDEYRRRFLDQMGGTDRPEAMSRVNPENLYKAQCLKDDTMAESMSDFLDTHPGTRIVSYQGDFHSAFGLGIVKKLKLLKPEVQSVVVSVAPVEGDWTAIDPEWKNQGDFVLVVPRHKTAR